jgi:hypothetical protein
VQRRVEVAPLDLARDDAGQLRMHERVDVMAADLVDAAPDHRRRRRIDERRPSIEVDAEHPFRDRVEDQLILFRQPRELVRLALQCLAFAEQLDEDADLRAQDLRLNRFEDVVDRAELVSAKDVRLAATERGEKDDRRVARFVAGADQARRLEAVEIRHLHVEQDDGELLIEQMAQRLLARLRHDQPPVVVIRKDRLQREQVVRLVVDQQDVDDRFGCHVFWLWCQSSTR